MAIGREPDVNLVLQWRTKRMIVLSQFPMEQLTLAAIACYANFSLPPQTISTQALMAVSPCIHVRRPVAVPPPSLAEFIMAQVSC